MQCDRVVDKSAFSSSQWSKGPGASRCKDCVAGKENATTQAKKPTLRRGTEVIMQGLVGRADLNGQTARVLGLQGERYQVEVLASGEQVAIKEQNLAPVQAPPVEGLPQLVPVPKPGPALLKQDGAVLDHRRFQLTGLKIRTKNMCVSKSMLDQLPGAEDTQAELLILQ